MDRSRWQWWLCAAGLIGAATAGACAYSASPALLPAHLKTVAIPVFENETTEYSLQQEITDAVIRVFVADNHLKVVDERSANAVIRGKIIDYRNAVFGISDVDRAEEYRVTIGVSVTFKDQVKNREIWSDEIVKTANYYVTPVPGDSARTELDGRRLAIVKIADEVLNRSVESW
jgi:hypothetical protein